MDASALFPQSRKIFNATSELRLGDIVDPWHGVHAIVSSEETDFVLAGIPDILHRTGTRRTAACNVVPTQGMPTRDPGLP